MIFLPSYAFSNQQSQDFLNHSYIHLIMLGPFRNSSLDMYTFLLSFSLRAKLLHFSPTLSFFVRIYPSGCPFDDCDYAATGSTASGDIILSMFIFELEWIVACSQEDASLEVITVDSR